jgi:hypothetical protein
MMLTAVLLPEEAGHMMLLLMTVAMNVIVQVMELHRSHPGISLFLCSVTFVIRQITGHIAILLIDIQVITIPEG